MGRGRGWCAAADCSIRLRHCLRSAGAHPQAVLSASTSAAPAFCPCWLCRRAAVGPAEHAERLSRSHHLLGRLVKGGPHSQRRRRQCHPNIRGGGRSSSGGRSSGGGWRGAGVRRSSGRRGGGSGSGCRSSRAGTARPLHAARRQRHRALLLPAVHAGAGPPPGRELCQVAPS